MAAAEPRRGSIFNFLAKISLDDGDQDEAEAVKRADEAQTERHKTRHPFRRLSNALALRAAPAAGSIPEDGPLEKGSERASAKGEPTSTLALSSRSSGGAPQGSLRDGSNDSSPGQTTARARGGARPSGFFGSKRRDVAGGSTSRERDGGGGTTSRGGLLSFRGFGRSGKAAAADRRPSREEEWAGWMRQAETGAGGGGQVLAEISRGQQHRTRI